VEKRFVSHVEAIVGTTMLGLTPGDRLSLI